MSRSPLPDMTLLRTTINPPTTGRKLPVIQHELAGRLAALGLALGISLGILLYWEQLKTLGHYGYPAVFLVSLVGNAALFLPAPSFALVLAAGASLDPVIVGLAAGTGAALGEMTGYLAGYSGHAVLQDRPLYNRIRDWMEKRGIWAIFLFAAVPNPFFDVGGIFAGAIRMPAAHFLFATSLGKSLRYALLAGIGVLAVG